MGQTSGRALWQSSYSAATAAARAALTGNRIRLDGSSEAEEGSSSHRLESDESTFNLMAIASAAAAACTSAPRELPSTNTTVRFHVLFFFFFCLFGGSRMGIAIWIGINCDPRRLEEKGRR